MLRQPIRWWASVAMACAASLPVTPLAQPPLTLAAAQAEARAHAPEAGELDARLRAASAIAGDALRALRTDPVLTGRYGSAPPGDAAGRSWGVGLSWSLDLSGSWTLRGASADAALRQATRQREDGLRALDEAVAVSVADLAFAQRQVNRSEHIAALLDVAADAAQRLLGAGQGSQLDVDAADLDLTAARASLAQARGARERARARLSRLLGRDADAGIVVDDQADPGDVPSPEQLSRLVDGDPRVRAAVAAVEAARLDLAMNERLLWPTPTFGVGVESLGREIPAAAFTGAPPGLRARWTDRELVATLSLPLPLFDRRREQRLRARAHTWRADARLATSRADVLVELTQALVDLRSSAEAYRVVSSSETALDRDYRLVDRALRAGAIDTVTRTQTIRRLVEAGARLDAAARDLRVARARWVRRAGGPGEPHHE